MRLAIPPGPVGGYHYGRAVDGAPRHVRSEGERREQVEDVHQGQPQEGARRAVLADLPLAQHAPGAQPAAERAAFLRQRLGRAAFP